MAQRFFTAIAVAALAAPLWLPRPALAGERIRVSADSMRMVNTSHGEAARAVGHVTILIPGELKIEAPQAQLFKGADGKLDRVVFPGWVRLTELKPTEGAWKTESNKGGLYDFKTRSYVEFSPRGSYEFAPARS